MWTAHSGHKDTMQALAALGADIHVQDSVVSPSVSLSCVFVHCIIIIIRNT